MINLNDPEEIKKLDPKDVYGSTELFADQCQQMIDTYYDVQFFNESHKSAKNIVLCGMGGSAYGGYIAQSLFKNELTVPLVSNNDYDLPAFTSNDSLVMLTSYSGSTEEVLSCGEEAKKKGYMITGFSSGGKLGEFLKEQYPGFTFNPKNNPSGQPRLGTGYIVMGTIILLNMLGVISVEKSELEKAVEEVRSNKEDIKKAAQHIAEQFVAYFPVIFSAGFLNGNAHILRNQVNETSKSFSAYEDIPELNHHLMEGFKYPQDNKMKVLFLNSDYYGEKHKKRIELTRDVVEKNNYETFEYKAKGSSMISQMLNTLSMGGYLTLYLGLLYGEDPSLIPWVDYFKEKLKA